MTPIPSQPPGSPPDWFLPGIAKSILYHTIGLTLQTFFFGIYASLAIYSIYSILTERLKNGIQKTLFLLSMLMFFISAIFWASHAIGTIRLISFNLMEHQPRSPRAGWVIHAQLISGAFALINYALTDAVVLWRAWLLCRGDFGKVLYIPLFFFCCASASITTTIVVRITMQCIPHEDGITDDPRVRSLTRAIDICQVGILVFSLLVNLFTTGMIALKAWRFRKWIRSDLDALGRRRTRGEKIMVTLVESGSLYCLSGTTALVATVTRLPDGTLGNLYTPVNTQLAGMYPIVVLLLVSHEKTLESTMFPRIASI
ncbi:hypothetical protein PM082_000115 [Marasmius tenuissimus]|nr:hypothetical protein PM082_000115 [Marasmius tenuissimus]